MTTTTTATLGLRSEVRRDCDELIRAIYKLRGTMDNAEIYNGLDREERAKIVTKLVGCLENAK